MIHKIKDKESFLEILYALEAFFSITPYIFWQTYQYSSFFNILKKIVELLIFLLFFCRKKIYVIRNKTAIFLSFMVIFLYYNLNTYIPFSIGIGTIIQCFLMAIFLILPNENKKNIFKYFLYIFSVSLIMGMFFSIINVIGIDIKADFIESISDIKINTNQHYRHYFGCVFREKTYYSPPYKLLCGMFDEPGTVGTISALLLSATQYNMKKYKINYILLIAGIMSMSIAFLVITFIYIIYYLVKIKKIKQLIFLIIMILISFMVIYTLRDNEILYEYIGNRIFGDYTLLHNNRTSEEFDVIYKQFLLSNNIFFGNGNNNPIFNSVDAASYKVLIFNVGFLGFFMIVGWFLYWGIKQSNKNSKCLYLLAIFLLSIYQRPWILYLFYIVILFGGIEFIKNEDTKRTKDV